MLPGTPLVLTDCKDRGVTPKVNPPGSPAPVMQRLPATVSKPYDHGQGGLSGIVEALAEMREYLVQRQAQHEAAVELLLAQSAEHILGEVGRLAGRLDAGPRSAAMEAPDAAEAPVLAVHRFAARFSGDRPQVVKAAWLEDWAPRPRGDEAVLWQQRASQRPSGASVARWRASRASSSVSMFGDAGRAARFRRQGGVSFRFSVQATDPAPAPEDACGLRRWARRLASSRKFEIAVAMLILANAAEMALQADWAIKHVGQPELPVFRIMEYIFAALFTFELALRVVDEGPYYASRANRNIVWNVFEAFVVASSWVEDVVTKSVSSKQNFDASAFRAARIVRLVRLLRIVRVMRFFKELRTMVQGIMASLKPLVWCLLLLLLVQITFGILIVQMAYTKLLEDDAESAQQTNTGLVEAYGGITATVYTLYTCITGGQDWSDAAAHLASPMMTGLFSLYIAFAVLCVLNIVTGVFVEHANSITRMDAENMVLEELQSHSKRMEEFKTMFVQATSDDDNSLTMQDFAEFCQNEKVQAYFRRMGLHVDNENAEAFFGLMDIDRDGRIALQEFINGCSSFIGNARQLDIAKLQLESAYIKAMLQDIAYLLKDKVLPGIPAAALRAEAAPSRVGAGASRPGSLSGMSSSLTGASDA